MTDTVEDLLARAAAKTDPSKHVSGAPPGYRLRGVSTLVDADGQQVMQWVKTAAEPDPALATLEAFRAAIALEPLPRAEPVPVAPAGLRSDLLTVYPMGDPHLGMLSWPSETGDDFNLQIAREQLASAVRKLVALAPQSETALLVNLGDFLHSDNYAGVTNRSGNALDTDSRWPKVLRVAVWCLIELVREALTKHARVRVINAKGNHDDQSAIMLSICMAAHFVDEPRVEIDESPGMFHYYMFGQNLIGVTHGHTVKGKDLPLLMATDRPAEWGASKYRFWLCGHIHHETVKEYPGVLVETYNTLAAKDAWHHGQGYRAQRSMKCDVYHREHGRVLRHVIGVDQL